MNRVHTYSHDSQYKLLFIANGSNKRIKLEIQDCSIIRSQHSLSQNSKSEKCNYLLVYSVIKLYK